MPSRTNGRFTTSFASSGHLANSPSSVFVLSIWVQIHRPHVDHRLVDHRRLRVKAARASAPET